ncbi:DUF1479-domain-containing protein [Camillea tinctor]|nr:DUF1479-domain-containing protein [Camillea tinctor]
MQRDLLPTTISAERFKQVLIRYAALIESISSAKGVKPGQKTLLELDKFRYGVAPACLQSEKPQRGMTHDDVKTLADWKLRHGKFRPTLMKLVSSNEDETVRTTIQEAMTSYWSNPEDPFKALDTITKLKGIGPATASLLLSVHDPERVIFFSDEAFYWLCSGGKTTPIKYNPKEYRQLNTASQALAKRLRVSAMDIEKVAYVLMKDGSTRATTASTGEGSNIVSKIEPNKEEASPKASTKRKVNAAAETSVQEARPDLASPHPPSHGPSTMNANFPSLLDPSPIPLSSRFAKIKRSLIAGHERAVASSFTRLLRQLRRETEHVSTYGLDMIPSIDYLDVRDARAVRAFRQALRKRGVAVIRRVVSPDAARAWHHETAEYLRCNPPPRGTPPADPQLFDLYWSPAQVRARADSRVLGAQRFAMRAWRCGTADMASAKHPVAYADRLRVRRPADKALGVGPHVDGGSVERWEPDGYGRGGAYARVFEGRWEEYEPWDAGPRLAATADLYNGAGSCSVFRMFQGWLALSRITPGSGSLLACPMLQLTTAYLLLRPFFSPRRGPPAAASGSRDRRDTCASVAEFLHEDNWSLNVSQTSVLHGAVPGYVQELTAALHPHLRLDRTMVPVPRVEPGDYVIWHPDLVHATDPVHLGGSDASVIYLPCCPLTQTNALYLARQRRAFLLGLPAPDFGYRGGGGEGEHTGRPGVQEVSDAGGEGGLRSMGLLPFDAKRDLVRLANGILFPDRFDALYKRGGGGKKL